MPYRFDAIAHGVVRHIKSMIGISTDVLVKKPGEIPRSQGKAVRVRDLRPARTDQDRARHHPHDAGDVLRLALPLVDDLDDREDHITRFLVHYSSMRY